MQEIYSGSCFLVSNWLSRKFFSFGAMIFFAMLVVIGVPQTACAQNYKLSNQYSLNDDKMIGVTQNETLFTIGQDASPGINGVLDSWTLNNNNTTSHSNNWFCCQTTTMQTGAVSASGSAFFTGYNYGSGINQLYTLQGAPYGSNIYLPQYPVPASQYYVRASSFDGKSIYGITTSGDVWASASGSSPVITQILLSSANVIDIEAGPNGSVYILIAIPNSSQSQMVIGTPAGTTYNLTSATLNRHFNTFTVDANGDIFASDNNNVWELVPSGSTYAEYIIVANLSAYKLGVASNGNLIVGTGGGNNNIVYKFSPLPSRNDNSMTKGLNVPVNSQELDYLGSDSHIHQIYNNGALGSGDLTVAANAPAPAIGSSIFSHFDTSTSHQEVSYAGSDQHVHQLYYDSSAWHHFDLTANYGGTLIASGSPIIAGDDPLGPTSEVDYIATDSHIHSYWYSSNTWHTADLTAITSAPNAAINSKLAMTFNTISQHFEIDYLGQDAHVHQLWYDATGWHTSDLTSVTGAPLAAGGSSLQPQITYLGNDQHIHQIWFDGNWHHTDLTTVAGAALAQLGSALAIDQSPGSIDYEISYVGTDQHLHVLYYQNSAWNTADLTSITNSPLIAPNSPVTAGYDTIASQPEIEYVGLDQHIYQLHYGSQGWQYRDLTSLTGATPVQ